MKIVISLGGSLITRDFSGKKIEQYAKTLLEIKDQCEKLIVVTGGGKVAREYIKILKEMNTTPQSQDKIAITITHTNAMLLALAINHIEPTTANETIPKDEKSIKENIDKTKIFICGGTVPGQSTDAVASRLAAHIKADLLINASNTDGVYDSDPNKNPDAKKYKTLSYEDFQKIIDQNEQSPGKYALFDKVATRTIKENKIKTIMIDGSDPKELKKAIKGIHSGTTIN